MITQLFSKVYPALLSCSLASGSPFATKVQFHPARSKILPLNGIVELSTPVEDRELAERDSAAVEMVQYGW